ncbi:competence type IV pilus minor pilin ComGD [Niallia sp. XMNu-256]|uniref:competence type IV pilus minor pilin ComGD n=1 Tax=Niallia sp. XMNu-256 TaxID=3082444 RepID=UPI0030D346E0
MRNNQAGFTLIESLIVLCIFVLLVSLSFFLIKPHYQFVEKERFISTFTSDILYAQQYAISNQSLLFFHIQSNENYFVKEKNTNKFIIDRPIPDSIKIEKGSLGKRNSVTFEILPDGGVSGFGTFFFVVGKVKYKVVFQIGAGRFYVVKE